MDADVAGLDELAAGGRPALRLYTWRRPALSLGRFQPDRDVDLEACRALGVEVVRRPTGGRALLHGADLTYAVVMARPSGAAGRVDALYRTLAAALIAGLANLGVEATIGAEQGPSGPACFAAAQGADLRVGQRKICGSAQVQRGGFVLQHGSVLLDRLPFDELDLLHTASPGPRSRAGEAHSRLRERSVTLADLGAPADPAMVAASIVNGFETTLDLRFESRVHDGT